MLSEERGAGVGAVGPSGDRTVGPAAARMPVGVKAVGPRIPQRRSDVVAAVGAEETHPPIDLEERPLVSVDPGELGGPPAPVALPGRRAPIDGPDHRGPVHRTQAPCRWIAPRSGIGGHQKEL